MPPTITYKTPKYTTPSISDEINKVDIVGLRPSRVALLDEVAPDGRVVIPEDDGYSSERRLYPIVEVLIERGHALVRPGKQMGFRYTYDGPKCELHGKITAQDWAVVNERCVVPETITYNGHSCIRDQTNWINIIGVVPRTAEEKAEAAVNWALAELSYERRWRTLRRWDAVNRMDYHRALRAALNRRFRRPRHPPL